MSANCHTCKSITLKKTTKTTKTCLRQAHREIMPITIGVRVNWGLLFHFYKAQEEPFRVKEVNRQVKISTKRQLRSAWNASLHIMHPSSSLTTTNPMFIIKIKLRTISPLLNLNLLHSRQRSSQLLCLKWLFNPTMKETRCTVPEVSIEVITISWLQSLKINTQYSPPRKEVRQPWSETSIQIQYQGSFHQWHTIASFHIH